MLMGINIVGTGLIVTSSRGAVAQKWHRKFDWEQIQSINYHSKYSKQKSM